MKLVIPILDFPLIPILIPIPHSLTFPSFPSQIQKLTLDHHVKQNDLQQKMKYCRDMQQRAEMAKVPYGLIAIESEIKQITDSIKKTEHWLPIVALVKQREDLLKKMTTFVGVQLNTSTDVQNAQKSCTISRLLPKRWLAHIVLSQLELF